MAGFRSITPNITINTDSGQLRTELLNTFSRLDGQLGQAPYILTSQNGPIGNVGAAETDLVTSTINFGTLNRTSASILIFACGQTAANGNNKTLKLKLGSTTLLTSGALASNDVDWTLQAEIVFNGGAAQIAWGQFIRNGASPIVNVATATEDFATNLTLKITGQGSATDDIAVYYWKTVLLGA